jgi:hypothetical protein
VPIFAGLLVLSCTAGFQTPQRLSSGDIQNIFRDALISSSIAGQTEVFRADGSYERQSRFTVYGRFSTNRDLLCVTTGTGAAIDCRAVFRAEDGQLFYVTPGEPFDLAKARPIRTSPINP